MATQGRSEFEAGRGAGAREGAARTLAQTACLAIGGALVAAGILGFFFGGSGFGTGNNVQGKDFIVFEVNGWHNIVHILTGALLLFASPKAKLAGTALLVFGVSYALVMIWGFIDGNDVINLIPVNTADNFLHLALTAAALLAAFAAGGLGAASRRKATSRRP
jgi:hypothetical protein